jgi:hypothetical protein
MGLVPRSYDPMMDVVPTARLREMLATMGRATQAACSSAPLHDSYFPAAATRRGTAAQGAGP